MRKLTTRQQQVLSFIRQQIETERVPPTVREIGNEFRITSPNGVMCHLRALEKKGYLTRRTGLARALQLVEPGSEGGD